MTDSVRDPAATPTPATWRAGANVLRLLLVAPALWLFNGVSTLASWARDAAAFDFPGPDIAAVWSGIAVPLVFGAIIIVTAAGLARGRTWAWLVGALVVVGLVLVATLGVVVAVTTPVEGTLLPGLANLLAGALAVVSVVAALALGSQLRRPPPASSFSARNLRPAAFIVAAAIATVAVRIALGS